MSRITWTAPAKADLESVFTYIGSHNRFAAMRCVRQIRTAVSSFKSFPYGGRPGEMENTREIIVPGLPYIVVYRIVNDQIRCFEYVMVHNFGRQ